MQKLSSKFDNRDELTQFIRKNFDAMADDEGPSPFIGTRDAADERLNAINPVKYCKTRNYYDGAVTRLSPYVRHGIMTLSEILDHALQNIDNPKHIEKFIQELAWRDYWQRRYAANPDHIWNNIEDYKTGYTHNEYGDDLPDDIKKATTPNAALNHFIRDLIDTGYMHNHTRMYIASYIVHWRRIKWQVGAAWFLEHLVDGDPASNNLSWQWIASTFSNKPYIFNLDNVKKYCGDAVNCAPEKNPELNSSYKDLSLTLFPNKAETS